MRGRGFDRYVVLNGMFKKGKQFRAPGEGKNVKSFALKVQFLPEGRSRFRFAPRPRAGRHFDPVVFLDHVVAL